MAEGLKPCPFCGNEKSPFLYRDADGRWLVMCRVFTIPGCGARTKTYPEPEKATEAWNRRANE